MKTHITLILMALAATGLAQTAPPQTDPVRRIPHTSSGLDLFGQPIHGHGYPGLEAGKQAEARGDYMTAERRYREYIDDRNGSPFAHIELAKLFDRLGRDKEAYAEYRTVVVGYGDDRGRSSDQENPVVLARYGDLARRFGTVEEARRAYATAARFSTRDDDWDPVPTPRSESFAALKSAAHTAAACTLYGWPTQERELRTAIEADPNYWVPHFYLAQTLPWKRRDEALREARLATSLAPSAKYQKMVARMRKNGRLLEPPVEASPVKNKG